MRNFLGPRWSIVQQVHSSGVVVISLQVGDGWLWSLIIFLFHRSLFSDMFIPL
jgi:hypothetical protein